MPAVHLERPVSAPPKRPPTAALIEALEVRRNATIGLAVGIVVAGLAYAYRLGELLGPAGTRWGSPLLFLLLAVVLAIGVGVLVTISLTIRTAVRVAGRDE